MRTKKKKENDDTKSTIVLYLRNKISYPSVTFMQCSQAKQRTFYDNSHSVNTSRKPSAFSKSAHSLTHKTQNTNKRKKKVKKKKKWKKKKKNAFTFGVCVCLCGCVSSRKIIFFFVHSRSTKKAKQLHDILEKYLLRYIKLTVSNWLTRFFLSRCASSHSRSVSTKKFVYIFIFNWLLLFERFFFLFFFPVLTSNTKRKKYGVSYMTIFYVRIRMFYGIVEFYENFWMNVKF